MNILIAIIVSIIPILILLKVIYEMGEVKKQPWWILLILFGFGILSWVLVKVDCDFDVVLLELELTVGLGNLLFFAQAFKYSSSSLIVKVFCLPV